MHNDNNPYSPPGANTDAIESAAPSSARSLLWVLSARFTLVVCAVAVTRTFPRGTDWNEALVFFVAVLSLFFFAILVFRDMNKLAN